VALTLSDAIRLGAMLHPQCFGVMAQQSDGVTLATCAMAAAKRAGYDIARELSAGSPNLLRFPSRPGDMLCPQCLVLAGSRLAVVVHLNDDHRWTREAIADWVELIERRESSTADPAWVSDRPDPTSPVRA
jgi:hypothetical protein